MASTQHYHFTLFESSDKPTWLTDWNNTISAIDTALYNIASGGGDLPDLTEVVARLQALEGRVDSDELRLNQVEGNIVDILADLQTLESGLSALAERVTDAEGDIADLETEVTINIPGQIQAINTSISGILTNYTALDGRVTALEQSGGGSEVLFWNGSTTTGTSAVYVNLGPPYTDSESFFTAMKNQGYKKFQVRAYIDSNSLSTYDCYYFSSVFFDIQKTLDLIKLQTTFAHNNDITFALAGTSRPYTFKFEQNSRYMVWSGFQADTSNKTMLIEIYCA